MRSREHRSDERPEAAADQTPAGSAGDGRCGTTDRTGAAPDAVPGPVTILPGAAIAGLDVADAPAVLRALSARLRGLGAVRESFEQAVLAREEKHPTGMPTEVPAAIPHTDPEHVITPGFAVASLHRPVEFGEIGSSGERTVTSELVIMLVLADAHSQLAALQNLVARLQEPEAVRHVLAASDDADLELRARDWLAGGGDR